MKSKEINIRNRVVMTYVGGLFHDSMDYREGTVQQKCKKNEEGSLNLIVKWDDGLITNDNEFTVKKLF